MGFKYKISNDGIYFITATVVDWVDVFTRKELAEIILGSLNIVAYIKEINESRKE